MMLNKLVFISSDLGYGGAPKIFAGLVNFLLSNKFDILIINIGVSNPFNKIDSRIRIIEVDNKSLLKSALHIKKVIKCHNLLIAFDNKSKLFSLYLSILSNNKMLFSERNDPNNYSLKGKLFNYFAYNFANHIVFQTKAAQSFYSKRIQKKSTIIPNFIFYKKNIANQLPLNVTEFIYIGRISLRQKQTDLFVQAANEIYKLYPNVIFRIYGDGIDLNKIKVLSSNPNLSFEGVVKIDDSILRYPKCFVLTSNYEGIPNALMEAMGQGMPIISTDYSPGSVKEIVKENCGIIIERQNVAELIKAMQKYLKNPVLAHENGLNARIEMQKYSIEKIIPLWIELIDSIIKKR